MAGEEVLIAYGSRVGRATLSGGQYYANSPLNNLLDPQLGLVAQTIDLNPDNCQFVVAYPPGNNISCIAIANHNMSLTAEYRIEYGDDPTFTTVAYDSGWLPVWPSVFATYDLEWGDDNFWGGHYLQEELENYVYTLTHKFDELVRPLYWRFRFSDPDNQSGTIKLGRLFMAKHWQPAHNMDNGADIGVETDTEIQKSLSGATFADPRPTYRVARFVTNGMTETEGMSKAFEIQRRSGIHEDVLFMWDPTDKVHMLRRTFLGRLRTLSRLEFPQGFVEGEQATRTGWEIEEKLP